MPADRARRQAAVLALLACLAGAAILAFMTLDLRGRLDFVLPLRATKLATLLLVAYAVAVSTVLFQTVTQNRILTPAVMGLDSLYVLIQTVAVFLLGGAVFGGLDKRLMFLIETAAMMLFAGLLYRALFAEERRSLDQLLLAGVVIGIFFRSLSGLLQRMIDPNDFVALQGKLFASFNTVDRSLLAVGAVLILAVTVLGWRMRHVFNVLALGRDPSIALGVEHRREVSRILMLIAVLVSVSTALVGPVTFFGLLVANLAYHLVPTYRHAAILPAAVLVAVICLVGGQVVLERVFSSAAALSIVIEFVGGIVFIILLLRGFLR
ncbi:iron chelate uptake ABC transporter family permease subunit [Enterovirga sp.]|uniref:iron chelate uptake ABC transporter family permease subunit n=1 Tax=Enterovirga sp. TaxID=2026350 RepID=UPI002C7927C8|nr:iron chelate uptake ABC transporter family permease subunit [Enterovirga sp.]HMO30070.1 iron chelate uptake ABC transporter family permease subunit [Enterovirga sp.]